MKNLYLIINDGLKGLVCAIELAKTGKKVIIIDERQEIGTPVNTPGLIRTQEVYNWITTFDLSTKTNINSFFYNEENWYGLRMEWLEKSLVRIATSHGVEIFLKTRVTSVNKNNGGEYVTISGAGRNNNSKLSGVIIDCTGNNLFNNLQVKKWFGGVANGHDMPYEWRENGWVDEKLMIPRKDGTIECWTTNRELFVEPNSGWLEIMNNNLPSFPHLSLDYLVLGGIELALEINNNNCQMSK